MELAILDFLQAHLRTDFGDFLMPMVSMLANGGWVWIVLTLVLLAFPKTRRIGSAVGIGLLLDVLLCNVFLKPLVARARPFDANPTIELLVPKPEDYSFPSGHTAASFTATSALFFSRGKQGKQGKLWIPALFLSVTIAFSRLYLYVHYPTDVLAGVLLGIILGALGSVIARRAWAKWDSAQHPPKKR